MPPGDEWKAFVTKFCETPMAERGGHQVSERHLDPESQGDEQCGSVTEGWF